MWTIHSLRPPSPDDGPFDTAKTGMMAAADVVVSPLPKPSSAWKRALGRFPDLPLEAELNRLCRTYNTEALSALAEGSMCLVKRSKRPAGTEKRDQSALLLADSGLDFVLSSKKFLNAIQKYQDFDLSGELQNLYCCLPTTALFALARVLISTLRGRAGRGRPRLQGFRDVPAETRAVVHSRRRIERSDLAIARFLEARLVSGQSKLSLRKRAQREVARVPVTPGRLNISLALATELWAITRAERQLENRETSSSNDGKAGYRMP